MSFAGLNVTWTLLRTRIAQKGKISFDGETLKIEPEGKSFSVNSMSAIGFSRRASSMVIIDEDGKVLYEIFEGLENYLELGKAIEHKIKSKSEQIV